MYTGMPRQRASFDVLLETLAQAPITQTEYELLRTSHWKMGQDARLREDPRFRLSPWQRWMSAEHFLVNDALHRELRSQGRGSIGLNEFLDEYGKLIGCRCVFCPGDSRFVLQNEEVRLSAAELSDQPVIEYEIGELEKYKTHLPLHTLKAAAASEPAGEWGPGTQEQLIETLGWIKVSTNRKSFNSRMFVAQIEGHSMDNGRSGLADGGYAIFELWPSGTKQGLNVLVRGSFHDPETGSYAVKRYVGDQRDEKLRHHEVKLVSLNPDKDRYPDIDLQPEDDEAVTIVARVVQALVPADYSCRPKHTGRKGRRDLESEEALKNLGKRLANRKANFFGDVGRGENDDCKPDPSKWNSQVICLDAGAGGLQLEIGPLHNLWKFVKVLVARSATGENRQTLASNARCRQVKVAALPSDGAWTWSAEGFEDDPDVDLSSLDVPGVPHDRVSVFHVGADGVGRLMARSRLSAGQYYRLILPPAISERIDISLEGSTLADGWKLIELELSNNISEQLMRDLEILGLMLGKPTPALSFALPSLPDEWRSSRGGDAFAVFACERKENVTSIISVEGYDAEFKGEVQLFVLGPDGLSQISLPAGDNIKIELSSLTAGQYLCSLLHQRTRMQPAYLPFEVRAETEAPPSADWAITVNGKQIKGAPNTLARAWYGDLSLVPSQSLFLQGAPGWPFRVLWRDMSDDYIRTLEFDANGQLEASDLLSLITDRAQRTLIGDLVLDFGELGAAVFEHQKQTTPQSIAAGLEELTRAKSDLVQRRAGAFTQLFPLWFEPVVECLGYQAEFVEELVEDPAPQNAAFAKLLVIERLPERIVCRCKRGLVMLEEMEPELKDELLEWIDRMCLRFEVDTVLISTGLQWAEHRRRSRLPLKVWELEKVLLSEESFIEFLRDVAEGV